MFLSLIFVNNMQLSEDYNSDTLMVDNPKISKISPKIHIIGNTGWADFYAEGNCTGAGISISPYVISDLILDAGGSGSGIIIENSDVYFIIKNSTIWNSGIGGANGGINLKGVANGTIENNTLYDNWHGVRLENSNDNLITNNTIIGGFNIGVFFYGNSHYNTVAKNIIRDGNRAVEAIFTSPSNNITIYNNLMTSNTYGMYLEGVNHTITDNIMKDNYYGISIRDSHDSKIFRNMINGSGAYGLIVSNSDNVKIVNNTLKYGEYTAMHLGRSDFNEVIGNIVSNNGATNGHHGVVIAGSSYIILLNNTISFNTGSGLHLYGEHDTTNYNQVLNNTIHNNGVYGVLIEFSNFNNISNNILRDDVGGSYGDEFLIDGDNNLFFANHFISASIYTGRDRGTNNKWNNTYIGNYWSSYTGVDANDDGIGDTPYAPYWLYGLPDFLPIWWDSPLITINSPYENDVFELSPTFNVSLSRGNVNQSWYTIDYGVTNITFTGLNGVIDPVEWDKTVVGQIDLTFYVNDSMGYIGSETVQVIKAYEAPLITINSPTLNQTFGFTTPEFNITINDLSPINATWYTIDGGLTNYTFSGLTGTMDQTAWSNKGTEIITLRFYANDSLGYVGFKDVVIWKDIIAPNIAINSPIQDEIFGNTSPEFNISIIEENLVSTWYTLEGVGGIFSFTGLNGSIDQGEWDSLPQGEISITFYAEDGVGNVGTESVIVVKSIPSTPSQPEIPGYNISIVLLGTFLVTIIMVVKKNKNK